MSGSEGSFLLKQIAFEALSFVCAENENYEGDEDPKQSKTFSYVFQTDLPGFLKAF